MAQMQGEILCCSHHFYTISVGILGLIGSFAPVARCAADIILEVSTTPYNQSDAQKRIDNIINHSAWLVGFLIYGFSSALLIIAVHQASRCKMIPWLICSAMVDLCLISSAFQTMIDKPQDFSAVCVPILYTLVWLGVVRHYCKLRSERVYNVCSVRHNYEAFRGYQSYTMWALPARPHIVLLEAEEAIPPVEV